MVLAGISILFGMIFKPIGQLLTWVAWPFTAYTIRMVEWNAGIPHGSLALGQIAFPLILIFYLRLFTITFARSRPPVLITHLTSAIPLAITSICMLMI
jgi:hypothetical protein